ncbi:MAG: GAF and ANTAR domain-containing protein [Mycobacterium sp.]
MTDATELGNQPVLTLEQAGADANDLRAGLADLAGLVADTLGLEELLSRVATYAVQAIPGADGAGVTLLRTDRPDNRVEALAASAPFVREIDEIQYVEANEGPCITAALERRTVRSGSLSSEKLWPRFGPRVGRLGVHSVLSLPLLLPGQVVGAINVYARSKDAFTEHAVELGELFAAPAAVAVHNAQVLAQARALAIQLQTALSSRPVIEQAIGILRARTGGTADEAFARLRSISQAENAKLAAVSLRIIDEAVRRARARHTGQ